MGNCNRSALNIFPEKFVFSRFLRSFSKKLAIHVLLGRSCINLMSKIVVLMTSRTGEQK